VPNKIDRVVFYIILAVSLLVRTLFIRHSIAACPGRDDTILYRLYYYNTAIHYTTLYGPYTKMIEPPWNILAVYKILHTTDSDLNGIWGRSSCHPYSGESDRDE
jgi:hypothetical protein